MPVLHQVFCYDMKKTNQRQDPWTQGFHNPLRRKNKDNEYILQNKVNQSQNAIYGVIPFIWNIQNGKIHRYIKQIDQWCLGWKRGWWGTANGKKPLSRWLKIFLDYSDVQKPENILKPTEWYILNWWIL